MGAESIDWLHNYRCLELLSRIAGFIGFAGSTRSKLILIITLLVIAFTVQNIWPHYSSSQVDSKASP